MKSAISGGRYSANNSPIIAPSSTNNGERSINISKTGSNASNNGNDVFNVFCVGMEAYAVVEQDGYSAQFIYRPPIYDGPLALNASVGYKFAQVPRITNDAWVINLRTTLSS